MTDTDPLRAAIRLHAWLMAAHWTGERLVGPDCGIRFNYRFGRFIKSYLRAIPWHDDLYYLQGQGYWILANWRLLDVTGDTAHAELARMATHSVVASQRPDGAWTYPNPEWRGRVANAEGTWAALGLLETYRRTRDSEALRATLRWYAHLIDQIGFTRAPGGLAANYFAGRHGACVPNNSAFVLRLLAELSVFEGPRVLQHAPPLVAFLATAQRSSGELPYQIDADGTRVRLPHFQCPQYNAFQCLDLLRYEAVTGDAEVAQIVRRLLRFLRAIVDERGRVPYACDRPHPEVTYHLGAVAAALGQSQITEPGCSAAAARVVPRLLRLQRRDGSFPHSRGDYGLLRDERSYPRHLAMLLLHLLTLGDRSSATVPQSPDRPTPQRVQRL
jgi:hypothetical protein